MTLSAEQVAQPPVPKPPSTGWHRPRIPVRKQPSKIFRALGINEVTRNHLDYAYRAFATPEEFCPKQIQPVRTFKTGIGALENLEIGPARVTLFGAPPKYGKTDLVTQLAVDAARLQTGVMVFIGNAEMHTSTLMAPSGSTLGSADRGFHASGSVGRDSGARVEGQETALQQIGYPADDEIGTDKDFIHASEGMYNTAVQFMCPPFSTLNLMTLAGDVEHYAARRPDQIIVVCDYVQRFSALDRSRFEKWKRYCERKNVSTQPPHVHDVDAVMSELRILAQAGVCVIAVSAMSRDSYDKATMGGFRGSSELEYAADDAYVLTHDDDRKGIVHLRHVASRNSATKDRVLRFDGSVHKFTPAD